MISEETIAYFDGVGRMMAKRASLYGISASQRMSSAAAGQRTKGGATGSVVPPPSVKGPPAPSVQNTASAPKTPQLGFPQIAKVAR